MNQINIFLLAVFITICSCKKSSYLEAKPDQKLRVPVSLKDFQAILDNESIMNGMGIEGLVPAFGEIASDDYYLTEQFYNSIPFSYRNLYIWNDDIYNYSNKFSEWSLPYRCIFYSNVVLDGLSKFKISTDNVEEFNAIKGAALFHRAHMFYQLAQIFSPPLSSNNQDEKLGIPLKGTGDINEKISRSSLRETYSKIIEELKIAAKLLPLSSAFKTRPSKSASFGLLARVYLSINDYDNALIYSDSCLKQVNKLIDYNLVDSTSFAPFTPLNDEVIFSSIINQLDNIPIQMFAAKIDTVLVASYVADDLRRGIYYGDAGLFGESGYFFKGSYSGTDALFSGIAIDEIYLIRAECYARKNLTANALDDLNTLMINRWKKDAWTPITATNSDEALLMILAERRKELIFRGLRWTDLRRLNQNGANIVLKRKTNGIEYILAPNDKHYTFLIPPDVTGFNPDMPQNPR